MWPRIILLPIGVAICLYALVVVWYAQQNPQIGLQCAFDTVIVDIDSATLPPDLPTQTQPRPGDRIVKIGPLDITTWSSFVTALPTLDNLPVIEVGDGESLAELERSPSRSDHVFRRDGKDLIRVELDRDGERLACWSTVGPPPVREFIHSLLWFSIKISLFVVVAIVLWKRPEDAPVRRFFILCIVTVGAFMGGYHWLRIASAPPLVLVFMICAVMLPVVTLHFYLGFPRPKSFLVKYPRLTLLAVYGVPSAILCAMLATYLSLVWTFRSGYPTETVVWIASWLRLEIVASIVVSSLMFAGCVITLTHSFLSSQPGSLHRNQIKWIFTGALASTIPIGYTLYLAVTAPERFGMGGAAWPMFLASLCFTVAYGISISRYGLMEVGQMLNWGIITIAVSLGAGVAYSCLVFLGTILIGSQLEPQSSFRQAAWVSLTAWLLLLGLDLFRWRMRKAMDRLLHREKYQLDKTLRRMSQAVEQIVDPPTLCRRVLQALSELLSFHRGAVYLRTGDSGNFRLVTHLGVTPPVTELPAGSPLVEALRHSPLVRVLAGSPDDNKPTVRQLTELGGELAIALRHERAVMAIVAVGPRSNGQYDIEELHLLTTFAQLSALALHGAQGRQIIEGLNRDMQEKVEKISEQQRRIVALQSQLLRQGAGQGIEVEQPPTLAESDGRVTPPPSTGGIIGSSTIVQTLLQTARKVAASPSAVLIRGESGTGKELLARALHENSARSSRPFVKVHCAALSPGLLESELFGHVKGAFTGAHKDKVGRFELANGGTLFLDEIGDINLDVQTKLLRVLQEMTFERVGSSEPIKVDVRVVAATHQNLERLMREGKFREDLFYRLNVITLHTPPLRDRREDIYELVLHFLNAYSQRSGKPSPQINDEALEILKAHDWPGNIRELENVIERAVVLAEDATITVAEMPRELVRAVEASLPSPRGGWPGHQRAADDHLSEQVVPEEEWSTQQVYAERDRLVRALTTAEGNKSKAARMLGMPRSTFVSRLEKHGLIPRRL